MQKPLVRLTRTAIVRETGSMWVLTKLSRLPLTMNALQSIEEDRTDFAVRRIQAVSSAELASGSVLPKWRLIRIANIRPDLLALERVKSAIWRALGPLANSTS
jgi:hypothetical protein